MTDEDLLVRCDSLLSLIGSRESRGLSDQTRRDLDDLLGPLRRRTDQVTRQQRPTVTTTTTPILAEVLAEMDADLEAGPYFAEKIRAALDVESQRWRAQIAALLDAAVFQYPTNPGSDT